MIKKVYKKFIELWKTPENLNQRAVRGSAVLYVSRFLTKGIAFIRTIIIARLLLPSDIGLVGLGTLAIAVTSTFFQTGFHDAIVQDKDDVEKHLDSAWTVSLFVSLLLAVVLFFVSAPLAGIFFHNHEVVLVTRFLSFMLVIQAFDNIGMILWFRNLQFNLSFFYYTIGYTVQLTITIIAALYLKNYWALVIGALAGKAIFLVLSYVFSSYRPKFDFSLVGAKHLFKYGKWISLAAIVSFFVSQGDYLTIGKVLNATSLAYYQMAFSLGTLPATEIVGVLSGLLFSLYANLQNDTEKLKNVFIRVSRLVFAISIPASVGLLVLSKEIVTFVYGEKWLPMVPILHVIVIYGLIKAFELVTEPLFRGIGKPHISTGVMIAQFVVMFSFIIPLTRMYGPVGTAWAVLFGFFTAQGIFLGQLRKHFSVGIISLLQISLLPIVASLSMALILIATRQIILVDSKSLLVAFIGYGTLLYVACLFILDKIFGSSFSNSLLWIKERL
ncbi:lipopolysaccharide biosynthesis protein [Candidatus Parcubacteria bacterium]|nr:lipopolysaccharide biosynthesis protein [Candidatus Parcubacteria bacterium]